MMKQQLKEILIISSAFLILGLALGHLVPSTLTFKQEIEDFENTLFEWDDDYDRYDISIREINEKGLDSIQHYYVSSSKAHLIYSEEEWSCFGNIVTQYNAWGRQINKVVKDFYINVGWRGEEKKV